MKRHFFIATRLDDLSAVKQALQQRGFALPQMHVLSEDDAALQQHHLPDVEAVLRKDVVRGTEVGDIIGVIAAILVLLGAYFSGVINTVGWLPFIFLAIVVLGFCTWEGGLFGIQEPNAGFRRFRNALKKGKHVFFVDVDDNQLDALQAVMSNYPTLRPAGIGDASPGWVVHGQKKWNDFKDVMP